MRDEWAGKIQKKMLEEIDKEMTKSFGWHEDQLMENIWISPAEKERTSIEKANRKSQKQIEDLMRQTRSRPDPVDKLRKEMREELADIKRAIRKIGVMLDGDAPSTEVLEKHKTLRDAYRKYKMIEALILGQQE